MATTYLTRTPASSGNRKTFTFSFWCKRSALSGTHSVYTQHSSSNDNNSFLGFNSSNNFGTWDYAGGYRMNIGTNRLFRDTSAWYHMVVAVDTTQATDTNRVKIYVNGVMIKSGTTAVAPGTTGTAYLSLGEMYGNTSALNTNYTETSIAIYDKELSADEIKYLARKTLGYTQVSG